MTIFALIHSPLVGPLTWSFVAAALRRRGHAAIVPELAETGAAGEPYWQRHSRSAAQAIAAANSDPVALAGHSGAGQLLPAIAAELHRLRPGLPPVRAYLFVDAGLPGPTGSRLERLAAEDAELARSLSALLAAGGRFPTWSEADLAGILPDAALRRALVAELRPRGLDFWSEPIPAFPDWPEAPCAYLQFTASYDLHAHTAQARGWPFQRLEAGHFHMLVDPEQVADELVRLAQLADE